MGRCPHRWCSCLCKLGQNPKGIVSALHIDRYRRVLMPRWHYSVLGSEEPQSNRQCRPSRKVLYHGCSIPSHGRWDCRKAHCDRQPLQPHHNIQSAYPASGSILLARFLIYIALRLSFRLSNGKQGQLHVSPLEMGSLSAALRVV